MKKVLRLSTILISIWIPIIDEVEDEYETAMEDKRKKDSVKLQGWWFTTIINSMEYANAVFDPFGVNLMVGVSKSMKILIVMKKF